MARESYFLLVMYCIFSAILVFIVTFITSLLGIGLYGCVSITMIGCYWMYRVMRFLDRGERGPQPERNDNEVAPNSADERKRHNFLDQVKDYGRTLTV